MFRLSLVTLMFSLGVHAQAPGTSSSFGRYVGTLKHDKLGVEQLAKMDFIVSRSSDNQLEMKAVLTLHFGDFASGEYVAYHFDNVVYDILSSTFVFDQAKEGVSLVSKRFANGELSAELASTIVGRIGEINLKLDGDARPTSPIIEPVSGEYKSKCQGKKAVMQLHTMRSIQDSSRVGNPFGTYDIAGQFGYYETDYCLKGKACQWSNVRSGAYNFFTGALDIVGNVDSWSCKVDGKGFSCDNGCRFDRVSNEAKSRVFKPPQASPAFVTPAGANPPPVQPEAIAGTYQGYLHHEYLDSYQPTEISLVTYQIVENGERKLQISASARLIFGSDQGAESISYRFEPRQFPGILVPSAFVLERLKDDVDAFLKITSMKDGVIQGEWYSLLFGRVGTFEVRKPNMGNVALPNGAAMITSVDHDYDNDWWRLKLVTLQARTPPNSENPYFPLDMAGTMTLKDKYLESKGKITGGSYDFYTGKIALQWKKEGLIIGYRAKSGELVMRTISNVFMSVIQDFDNPRVFSIQAKSGEPK